MGYYERNNRDTTLKYSIAMRGRYRGGRVEQQLELNHTDCVNAITTVSKDSMILEIRDGNKQNRTDGQHD
jgi:hypothetical protein